MQSEKSDGSLEEGDSLGLIIVHCEDAKVPLATTLSDALHKHKVFYALLCDLADWRETPYLSRSLVCVHFNTVFLDERSLKAVFGIVQSTGHTFYSSVG